MGQSLRQRLLKKSAVKVEEVYVDAWEETVHVRG